MITLVLEVMAALTANGSSVNVSSTSTKIGTAPIANIDSKLATKVKEARENFQESRDLAFEHVKAAYYCLDDLKSTFV